jgi:hypothetical protein
MRDLEAADWGAVVALERIDAPQMRCTNAATTCPDTSRRAPADRPAPGDAPATRTCGHILCEMTDAYEIFEGAGKTGALSALVVHSP